MQYMVQYEKFPGFCFFCGCMGHEMTECSDGVHPKESCQWGDWLLANFNQNAGGRGEGRDTRTRGGMA